jgi:serine/alanine adding enzyme
MVMPAGISSVPATYPQSNAVIIRAVHDIAGEWQQVVHAVNQSTLAHAPEWFRVIRDAYGHTPLYFAAEDEAGRHALLPAFIVRRPFGGTVVASMPFLDGGGPCSPSGSLAGWMVDHLIDEGRRLGARVVEMRCAERLPIAFQPMEHKVNLVLTLCPDPGGLWRRLDKDVRNQVRKAERCGLSIEVGGVEKLTDFYDVFASRMRDLGSPVHGVEFFRAVLEAFAERARIVLVRLGPAPIGGLMALQFKDSLTVPWAACLKEYRRLCPNMLLYWETIQSACSDGFGRFDFGRSTRNSGTYRFKSQWGAREEPLFWYTIPIDAGAGARAMEAGPASLVLAKAWQQLPVRVTRRLGPRIRRYLIQ